MFKKYALNLALGLSIFAGSLKAVEITRPYVLDTKIMEDIKLHHRGSTFYIEKDKDLIKVQNCFVDSSMRGVDTDTLQYLLGAKRLVKVKGIDVVFEPITVDQLDIIGKEVSQGHKLTIEFSEEETAAILKRLNSPNSYIEVKELDSGEYCLHLHHRLNGGGVLGGICGAWAGKFVASALTHGVIALVGVAVSCVATPAAGVALVATLEGTFGASIEAFTTAAALAGGIAAAVATGPA